MHPHGAFQQLVVRVSGFQFALKLPADLADTVVQMLDDMEHVNADHSLREDVSCHGNKAVVHVTPVKADFYRMITKAVMWRDCAKNFEEILIGQNAGFALGRIQILETGGSIF